MITLSQGPRKITDTVEAVNLNHVHWLDNHNGTITCDKCHTWFNKDDRYEYMRHCPYCGLRVDG